MNGNTFTIKAMSLLIVGLMITMTATATQHTFQNEDIDLILNWNTIPEQRITIKATEMNLKPTIMNGVENTLPIPLFEGMHPTVAVGGSAVMMGFDDLEMQGTWFTASPDGGQTWFDAVGWDYGMTELPNLDYWAGSKFVGAMTPDYTTSGQIIQLDFEDYTDTSTWLGGAWDIESFNIYDITGTTIAAGDDSLDDWRFGFITFSCYNGYDEVFNENPMCLYPTDGEGYATFSWFYAEGCTKPASDMDKTNQMHYAVWQMYNESSGLYDIFFRTDNFDYDPDAGANTMGGVLTTGMSNENLDISAENDNVIIVAESEGDIICHYSTDGFDTFETSLVISGASNPRIGETGDNKAVCSFVMDGNLYASITDDGGATWGEPTLISDGQVIDDYHESDICEGGAVYTATDDIIYFEPGVGGARPIVTIGSVSGGIGISVDVENIGDADAVDVPYTLTATGGILGLINKEVEGTITISAGSSATVTLPMIIGLGSISIDVNVGSASETFEGTQILFFTSI